MGPRDWPEPPAIRFGRGIAAEALAQAPRPLLLVTGRGTLERAGLLGLLQELDVHHATPVEPLPRRAQVEALAREVMAVQAATVAGVGGGSALDAAKTAALLAGNAPSLARLRPESPAGRALVRRPWLMLLPTTAGTGSEVTPFASLWDGRGRKSSVVHRELLPDLAVIDPALSDGMDARLTAATGLDAVAHAMESLWCESADGSRREQAVEALRLLSAHLPAAVRAAAAGRNDERARDAVAEGALRAGLAIAATTTAAAHALSYGLTGRHGLPHGLAVGLLCRALIPLQARLVPARVGELFAALDRESPAAAQAFLDEVLAAAGLRPSLAGFGVERRHFAALVDEALAGERLANNAGPPTREDLLAALESVA